MKKQKLSISLTIIGLLIVIPLVITMPYIVVGLTEALTEQSKWSLLWWGISAVKVFIYVIPAYIGYYIIVKTALLKMQELTITDDSEEDVLDNPKKDEK